MDQKTKGKGIKITWLDLAILGLMLAGIFYLAYRVKSGLHYKWHWEFIPQYIIRLEEATQRWVPNMLLQGLLTTIRLSVWSTILATVIGTVMGLFRVSPRLFKRLLAGSYVELVRNLPPLVLIFIFYFFLSDQIMALIPFNTHLESGSEGTRKIVSALFGPPSMILPFVSAIITLAIFEGAYITEIVRAGIQAVEKGQWEAAYALGLSRWQQMRVVILPQAVRKILPPLGGQFISTVKDSAIVSVISIPELTFQGMELMSSTFLRFEIWITITAMYLILTLALSLTMGRFEVRMRRHIA